VLTTGEKDSQNLTLKRTSQTFKLYVDKALYSNLYSSSKFPSVN